MQKTPQPDSKLTQAGGAERVMDSGLDSSFDSHLDGGQAQEQVSARSRTRLQRLGDILLSTDPRIRPRTPMGLVAALLYLPLLLMVNLYAVPRGVLSPGAGWLFSVYCVVGMLGFYLLVRSGFSQRFTEPSLSLPQMIFAEFVAASIYLCFPEARATALQLLCVIQIFGLLRLPPKGALVAGVSGVGVLLWAVATSAPAGSLDRGVQDQLLVVAMESLVLIVLALLSYRYSRLRHEVEDRKKELADAVAKVRRLVMHDPLTGLYNRQRMQQLLERESQRSAYFGKSFCVALIDLDHFKRVNDTHGHQVGDEVLCGFADAARHVLRDTDFIARWGGEEFLVLFPDTEPEQMGRIGIDRLLGHVAQSRVAPSQPALRVTFSAGIAVHETGGSTDRTVEIADKALYAAKAAGRNRCVIAQ